MTTLRIGIIGTQAGTTPDQRAAITALLVGIQPAELHHGDCIGADSDIHDIARRHTTARVIIHPPDNPTTRAHRQGDEQRTPLPYLVRNHAIVDATDRLVAAPAGPELQRAATWTTVRYAMRAGRRITIVWPNGSTEERWPA